MDPRVTDADVHRARARLTEALAAPAAAPGDAPHLYGAFLARLRTFTPRLWFAKPACIAPGVCAQRGWSCTGEDRLACGACRAELSFRFSASLPHAGQVNAARAFAVHLDAGHQPLCVYRGAPCDAGFLAFQNTVAPREHAAAVRERLASFAALDAAAVARTAVPEAVAARLRARGLSLGDVERTLGGAPLRGAVLLALTGWTAWNAGALAARAPDETPGPLAPPDEADRPTAGTDAVVCCQLCMRRVGLWLFMARAGGTEAPEAKRRRLLPGAAAPGAAADTDAPPTLDPIGQHAAHCPFVALVDALPGAPDDRPPTGWEVALDALCPQSPAPAPAAAAAGAAPSSPPGSLNLTNATNASEVYQKPLAHLDKM